MKTFLKRYAVFLFFSSLLLFEIGALLENEMIQFISKPLLMPFLMAHVILNTSASRSRLIIAMALLFAFFGDISLLVEFYNPIFFIIGLLCFLLTHIFYISYFLTTPSLNLFPLKINPLILLLVTAYGIGLLFVLYPHLGVLKIPVTIYAFFIIMMLLSSFHLNSTISINTGKYFVLGALLFVVSDSILAFNKFYFPVGVFSHLIIISYCLAQWIIIKGFIKFSNEDIFIKS